MRNVKAFITAMVSMLWFGHAHAQWAVIDAANLRQQIMNVVSTIKQETNQAQQLLNQYQQLKNEYQQLKSLPGGAVNDLLGTVQGNILNQSNYLSAVRGLYGDVASADKISSALYARMAASGLSQQEWMAREAERNQANREGAGYLSNYEANVLQQVGQRYQEVQRMQSRITGTAGTHESMQLMNSQMNVLVSTLNQVVEQNAAMGQRMAIQSVEQVGRKEAAEKAYDTWARNRKQVSDDAERSIRSIGTAFSK